MGSIRKALPVKLIAGFIYRDIEILKKAEAFLVRKFGAIDDKSSEFIFSHTRYYEKEMGSGLKRMFVSFEKLIKPDKPWLVKTFTNRIENKFCKKGHRTINIDPGYITLGKLVLLTTKDYTHRLYLGGGIYGEVTLFFKDDSYRFYDYTYPDYKTKEYIDFFNRARANYKPQIGL